MSKKEHDNTTFSEVMEQIEIATQQAQAISQDRPKEARKIFKNY